MNGVIIILVKINTDNENSYRFKINTNRFRIHYKISDIKKSNCPLLGLSAREGIVVLYKHPVKNVWTNIRAFNKNGTANIDLFQCMDNGTFYEIIIYSPLLARLEEVNIEFGDRYEVVQSDKPNGSILVMGGQKTFGIGCTTAGTTYANIIGRKFNSDVVNVSYLEDNYLEKLNEYMTNNENERRYDIGILELDYLNNSSINELKEIVRAMNSCCEEVIGWYAFTTSDDDKKEIITKGLSDEIDRKLINILDVSTIFNENGDMCSYNDKHINDAGNVLIYKTLSSTIKGVL